MTNIVILFS